MECRLKILCFNLTKFNIEFQFIEIFSSLRFERLLPEGPYNAMQNRYRDNENYVNEYEAFLIFFFAQKCHEA